MYEGIHVHVAFAGFFLAKVCMIHIYISRHSKTILTFVLLWLGKHKSFLDDLVSLDPDLYHGLIFLKHYTGNPEDPSLNFTVAVVSARALRPSPDDTNDLI
jgi:ubiquitin-protein ligase E3 C